MCGNSIPGTGDLHVVGAQASCSAFGRFHQRSSDSLTAKRVINHERHEASAPGGVFKKREDMQRRHTGDRVSHLGDHEGAVRIFQPVLHSGLYVARASRIPQLAEQGRKRR